MPRAPGAGRKPGTLNKGTLDLMSELEKKHFNIITERLRVYEEAMRGAKEAEDFWDHIGEKLAGANGGKVFIRDPRPEFLKVANSAIADLFNYVYPKRKSIEMTGKDGAPLLQSFTELMEMAARNAVRSEESPRLVEPSPEES